MKRERERFFSSKTGEEIYSLNASDFTVSEINEIIDETVLNDVDRQIAILKYVKDETIASISEQTFLDAKTVQRRIPKISHKLKKTLLKIFNDTDNTGSTDDSDTDE